MATNSGIIHPTKKTFVVFSKTDAENKKQIKKTTKLKIRNLCFQFFAGAVISENHSYSPERCRTMHINSDAGDPQSPNILIVDDEIVIAESLAAILKRAGYNTRAAYGASDALALTREFFPDLLITDVAMPGMNGIDFAIQMRAIFPQCKILIFSGKASTAGLLEDAKRRGHNFEFLAKPIHPTDLLAALGSQKPSSPQEEMQPK